MTTPPGSPGPYGIPGGAGADPRTAAGYGAPPAGQGPGPGGYGPPPGGHGPPAGGHPPQVPGQAGGPGPAAGQAPPSAGWVPSGTEAYRKPEPAGRRGFAAAPRRSRFGLAAQFVLQFVYIPVWALIALALLAAVIFIDSGSNANIGLSDGVFGFVKTGISWRRLRAEWSGRAESWAPFTDARFAECFAKAEKSSGWAESELPPSGVRRATCELPVRYYRGLDSAAVEQLAQRRGWSVDWAASKKPAETLQLFRLIPPPPLTGVPDPYAPAPGRGAPWGPLPRRFAMPLLTFVFLPRMRALELRGSADAYLAHLRAHLPERIRTETARDPHKGYRADESGRILRRVAVRNWHFRGVGAQAVLFVAAEQGWRIDHSFPARPDGTVHLCRPDTTSSAAAPASGRG
ncbi:hypothetical protein SAMN05216223_12773 [Actinacidiphila yanglinensis]|uniref:Uncharacterized protein n=1 Tax=Actinacidiphila yanglinensis TaxID=310779 RepID=A0A1H6E6E5_9ACTN|nr:hypothetical protein [Actinacidiphila yanglinensis]SEG93262.1 hypothetical protein SAMN05216223_12773 [Actinacidiphila yanglinensis]